MRGLLILGAIILTIAGCIHEQEATNHNLPLVHASEPASVVPWRLLTTCPIDRRNIPHYQERTA